jgi:hypothetical protein
MPLLNERSAAFIFCRVACIRIAQNSENMPLKMDFALNSRRQTLQGKAGQEVPEAVGTAETFPGRLKINRDSVLARRDLISSGQ